MKHIPFKIVLLILIGISALVVIFFNRASELPNYFQEPQRIADEGEASVFTDDFFYTKGDEVVAYVSNNSNKPIMVLGVSVEMKSDDSWQLVRVDVRCLCQEFCNQEGDIIAPNESITFRWGQQDNLCMQSLFPQFYRFKVRWSYTNVGKTTEKIAYSNQFVIARKHVIKTVLGKSVFAQGEDIVVQFETDGMYALGEIILFPVDGFFEFEYFEQGFMQRTLGKKSVTSDIEQCQETHCMFPCFDKPVPRFYKAILPYTINLGHTEIVCEGKRRVQRDIPPGVYHLSFSLWDKASTTGHQSLDSTTIFTEVFTISKYKTATRGGDDIAEICIPAILHPVRGMGIHSTARSDEEILAIFQKTNDIWKHAGITFKATLKDVELADTTAPTSMGYYPFMTSLVQAAEPNTLHIYFVRDLAGANGWTVGQTHIAVADVTTVDDFRTIAHEIGHILGLPHKSEDGTLMQSGYNGQTLSDSEIKQARKRAEEWQECQG